MTQDADPNVARLAVDRGEFLEGLRALTRQTKPKSAGEAVLRYEEGQLEVAIGGGAILAAASGSWPGEARVPGLFVLALAQHPPAMDPLPIWVEADRLHVAATSVSCHWQRAGAAQVEIPIGATLAEVLRIGLCHPDEILEQSGILQPIEAARARRRRMVAKAAEVLSPLGVRRADVDRLVDLCLRPETR